MFNTILGHTILTGASQIWSVLVGFIAYPIYLSVLGKDQFGVFGFYLIVISFVPLADFGVSALLGRESAILKTRYRDSTGNISNIIILSTILEVFFIFILIGAYRFTDLNFFEEIGLRRIEAYVLIILFSLIFYFRILVGWFRALLFGVLQYKWLSINSIIINSLRGLGPILSVYIISNLIFLLSFITIVSAIEVIMCFFKMKSLGFSFERELKGFGGILGESRRALVKSSSNGFAVFIWSIFISSERFFLSREMRAADVGLYALISTLCGGLTQLFQPILQTFFPKISFALEQNDNLASDILIRRMFYYILCVLLPVCGAFVFCGVGFLEWWLGKGVDGVWGMVVFPNYVVASLLSALVSALYYLQLATNNLSFHLRFTAILSLTGVPVLGLICHRYGAVGSSLFWVMIYLICFIVLFWRLSIYIFKIKLSLEILSDFAVLLSIVLFFAISVKYGIGLSGKISFWIIFVLSFLGVSFYSLIFRRQIIND